MAHIKRNFIAVCVATFMMTGVARSDEPADPTPVSSDGGKYFDKDGRPTYKVDKDGKVDFYSYNGFIRYSANCMHCHGPDGLGSTYAPSLATSLKTLDYAAVLTTVANGKKEVSESKQLVMPSLGEDKNVMCYIDSIYIYLRARSDGAIPRGRPRDHEPKPEGFSETANSCME
nr:c-type cytochrome, methanol metabolism-related [uncultured Rhodopila sp.]